MIYSFQLSIKAEILLLIDCFRSVQQSQMQTKALHQMMTVQREELEEKTKEDREKDRIIRELRKELDTKKGA